MLVLSFFTSCESSKEEEPLPFWSTVSPWFLRLTRPKQPLNTTKPSSAPSCQGPPLRILVSWGSPSGSLRAWSSDY
jgi:hypothetical protein